jgi:uncharacterized protein
MSQSHLGRFVWYELMTTDAPAAQAFYQGLMGWQTQDAGMSGMPYTLLSAAGVQMGGLMGLPPEACEAGAQPGWMGYVAVPDVDAWSDRVIQAGGQVMRPASDIPGVGRFAVVADPHGAAFVLFKGQSDQPPAPAAPGTPGHTGWHELQAGELSSAWAFYADLFGWTLADAMDMGPMGTYQMFAIQGQPSGGMMNRMPDVPQPFWLFYFNVDDIDAAAARTTALGGQVLVAPHEVPGGDWILQGLDPQGAVFAVVGPRRTAGA